MAYASREKARAYQREYNRTHPERRNAIHRAYVERNRDAINAYQREWRAAHLEDQRAKQRAYYQEHKEEFQAKRRTDEQRAKRRAYYLAHREEMAAKQRALRALKKEKKAREEKVEMAVELEKCPECGSAGAAKVQGQIYLAGCSKSKCEHWVSGENSETGATVAEAVERWNEFAREERAAREAEAHAAEEEEAAADETRQDAASPEDAGEPPAPPEEEEDDEDEDEEEDGDEEAAEASSRFWLELDGTWYWLEAGCERCEGCAFRLAFGKREICAAASSEDFAAAATLCETLGGVWRENDDG